MPRYDTVIVGSGPAGLEAALNLRIRNKRFLLFGSSRLSDKIRKAPKIDNYLGLPALSGEELAERFARHLEQMDIAVTEEQVSTVYPMGDYFAIATNRQTCESLTVILATGAFTAKHYPGEEEFLGRGVGYCATCDAPLYRGKTVAVAGWGDESVHEANFVAEIAAKVYYIPVKEALAPLSERIEVVRGGIGEIRGGMKAEELTVGDRVLRADGIFILREAIAPASLVPGIALSDGFIQTDGGMHTSIPGCFAAGDCTGKPHQYMRAAGQGQTAALNAAAYIDLQGKQKGSSAI